jgi:hypothetical protein
MWYFILVRFFLFITVFWGFGFYAAGQNCPQYSSTVNGGTDACGNQNYIFQVDNTGCNGTITFNVVGNYGSSWAGEITWNVTSQLTGGVVASGGPGTDGANINVTVGPLNPNIVGTVFTLNIFDSFGDGFNGTGGTISIQQGGITIAGPITGNFGSQASSIFGANIIISAATLSVNTPSGPVTATAQNCSNFSLPINIQNSNYCTDINVALPWTITCDATGTVLASGIQNLTVRPGIPISAADLVSITWDPAICQWITTGENDCNASHIGTIFSISPDPATPPANSCAEGTQNFQVT